MLGSHRVDLFAILRHLMSDAEFARVGRLRADYMGDDAVAVATAATGTLPQLRRGSRDNIVEHSPCRRYQRSQPLSLRSGERLAVALRRSPERTEVDV